MDEGDLEPRLALPGRLSAARFLAQYWQRRALFLPDALPGFCTPLSADEIAGLACEADVEARLILTTREHGRTHYELTPGPFRTERLEKLGPTDWTLLVHDVEKHLPDLRPILRAPRFLPGWRMGDLMVSVAAPGGSVGPHQDSYDVFLLQGSGERSWQLGSGRAPQQADPSGLRLLADFQPETEWTCGPGDAVYVPPGIGHHGVATSLCTTWSIGLQAPLLADLALLLGADTGTTLGDTRYSDPDLSPDECVGGLIAPATLERCRRLLPRLSGVLDEELAEAFGRLVTLPKPGLRPEALSRREAATVLDAAIAGKALRLHGMCASACSEIGGTYWFFAAGQSFRIEQDAWPLALILADLVDPAGADVGPYLRDTNARSLLADLARLGLVELAEG